MVAQRAALLQQLKSEEFDLLVVGGGITGAGIALDAASRGLKTALVEKRDFASGTSSKSTKLIHGGLRYLKQFEFGLVREVGLERGVVHKLAPHMVKAEKMLLPIMEGGTFGKTSTSFGLWLYDQLAGVTGSDRRRMLTREETANLEPALRKKGLIGGGLYAEYRTDDARLTIELIKAALRHQAVCLNYIEIDDFTHDDSGCINGAICNDLTGNEHFKLSARHIVSAAGPWVDQLREKDKSLHGKRLFLSKGVHIVVSGDRLPIRHAVYFDVPDGRMLFAIPRHRATYIGTTDTPFSGNPDQVFANPEDVDYLLAGVNSMFPGAGLGRKDVESTWAGLRPLIYEEGKSASEMSRRDEIFESASGLISIAGGKLTGYRKMAERVTDLVAAKLSASDGRQFGPCRTKGIPLQRKTFSDAREALHFAQALKAEVTAAGLPGFYADYLVENYGHESLNILGASAKFEAAPETALLRAELDYCLTEELVLKPADFLERRTGRLYFYIKSIGDNLEVVLEDMGRWLGWTEDKKQLERAEMQTLLRNVRNF